MAPLVKQDLLVAVYLQKGQVTRHVGPWFHKHLYI